MTNDQCSCTKDKEVTCIVHPTPRSMKERIAELEAELTKARDNVVGTRRIFHQYLRKTKEVRLLCLELEAENRRLREAAFLALRCKTLPEAAQAKAALEAALKGEG